MWSPAALMESTAMFEGRPARLLLFASGPGGAFDGYGSSSYSLLLGDQKKFTAERYVPRETLSSLIANEGTFYHLTVEGQHTNGLPARVLLVKDTSPTGVLAVKFSGTTNLQTSLSSLYLSGADDKTVFFRVSGSDGRITLPVGRYALDNGMAAYGASNANEWETSFTQGPRVRVREDETSEQPLGQPVLRIRAIAERDRYSGQATETASYKQGARIYLEPKIVGKGREIFSRFRQSVAGKSEKVDRPPRITITGPDGKQLLSQVMEYG